MKCQAAERKISAYIDMELAADDRAELEQHFQVCPVCVEKYERMMSAWTELSVLPVEPIAPFFYTRVQARMKKATLLARFKDAVLVPISFGIVILLGVITGNLVVSENSLFAESALPETSVTQSYIEDHLQDFPEDSFAQGYMDMAALAELTWGE